MYKILSVQVPSTYQVDLRDEQMVLVRNILSEAEFMIT